MGPGEPDGPVDPAVTAYGLRLVRDAFRQAVGMNPAQIRATEAARAARAAKCSFCEANPRERCTSAGAEVDWIHPSRMEVAR